MEVGDLATGIGGTTGGLYALYRVERVLTKLWAKRNGNGGGGPSTETEAKHLGEIATHMASMAQSAERTAEAVDSMRDGQTAIKESQAILLRTLEREVIPHLKP